MLGTAVQLPTAGEADMDMLFRLVMLCQITDDIMDVAVDTRRGVPSFLTAMDVKSDSLSRTYLAAGHYARNDQTSQLSRLFPFRIAVATVFRVASAVLAYRRRLLNRHHTRIVRRDSPDSGLSPGDEQAV